MSKQPKLTSRIDKDGNYVFENVNEVLKWAIETSKKTKLEVHADGVKEVTEECPFCEDDPCNEPHCPYTEK
jgi:hypothetical protein